MHKYIQFSQVYFGGAPKIASKSVSPDEEEINAVNEGNSKEDREITNTTTKNKYFQRQR